MTSNPTLYAAFLAPKTIDEYTKDMMVVGQEIEDVGNAALYDAVLGPAGLGMEILYLNRSEGERIGVQERMPEEGVKGKGVVRLLYRP